MAGKDVPPGQSRSTWSPISATLISGRHDAILVVGHNPTLSEFLGRTISENGCEAVIDLKKGAVARAEMNRNAASLTWCLTPKILRTLYTAAAESSRPKTSRK